MSLTKKCVVAASSLLLSDKAFALAHDARTDVKTIITYYYQGKFDKTANVNCVMGVVPVMWINAKKKIR